MISTLRYEAGLWNSRVAVVQSALGMLFNLTCNLSWLVLTPACLDDQYWRAAGFLLSLTHSATSNGNLQCITNLIYMLYRNSTNQINSYKYQQICMFVNKPSSFVRQPKQTGTIKLKRFPFKPGNLEFCYAYLKIQLTGLLRAAQNQFTYIFPINLTCHYSCEWSVNGYLQATFYATFSNEIGQSQSTRAVKRFILFQRQLSPCMEKLCCVLQQFFKKKFKSIDLFLVSVQLPIQT